MQSKKIINYTTINLKHFFKKELPKIADCLIQYTVLHVILNLIHTPNERLEVIRIGKIKHVHSLMKTFLWCISYSEWPEAKFSSSRLLLEDPTTSERMKKCVSF